MPHITTWKFAEYKGEAIGVLGVYYNAFNDQP